MLAITGIALTKLGKLSVQKIRWLALHLGLGVLVIINAIVILALLGIDLSQATQDFIGGTVSIKHIRALELKEAMFGSVNIILCVLLVIIAVNKPNLRSK